MAIKQLSAIISIGASMGGSVKGVFGGVQAQLGQVGAAIQKVKLGQKQWNQEVAALKAAGRPFAAAEASAASYGRQLDTLIGKQARLRRQAQRQADNKAMLGQLTGELFRVAAMATPLIVATKLAGDFQESIAKVGQMARASKAEQQGLAQAALMVGRTTQFSAQQGAEAMFKLADEGYKANEIMAAMPAVADLAASGHLEIGRAAEIAAKSVKGFGLAAGNERRVADIIANSGVEANAIGQVFEEIGPKAKTLGVAIEDVAAATAALDDDGQGRAAAATLGSLMSAMAGSTGKAGKMLNQLGVQTRDAQGNILPLGVVLGNLNEKMQGFGEGGRTQIAKVVFGVDNLAGATTLLKAAASGGLEDYRRGLGRVGAAHEQAAGQSNLLNVQARMLKSQMLGIGVVAGSVLLPPAVQIMKVVGAGLGLVAGLATRFPKLTQVLVIGAAALIGLTLAITAVKIGFIALSTVMATNPIGLALVGISLAIGLLIAYWDPLKKFFSTTKGAIIGLGILMLATPIGPAIVGIALGARLIIKHWTPIKGFFTGVWGLMKDGAMVVWDFLKLWAKWSPLGPIIANWSLVKAGLGEVWGWIHRRASKLWGFMRTAFSWTPLGMVIKNWQPIKDWFQSLFDWIGDKLGRAFAVVGKVYDFLDRGADKTFKIGGPEPAPLAGARAAGGPVTGGRSYLVGERGPEIFTPGASGAITPNHALRGGGQQVNVTIHVAAAPGQDAVAMAERVYRIIQDRLAAARRGSLYDGEVAHA